MSCSFCNLRGHNITTCDDIFIDIHYHRIKNIYIYILRQIYPNNIENYTELGRSILNRTFNLRSLRAIGVQYCWVNARMTKAQLIPIIWNYFKTRIYYPPSLPEEQLLPEYIIDRTPSPLLLRHDINTTMSGMMSYYTHDQYVVNAEIYLMRRSNVIPPIVRNLVTEFNAVAEVEALIAEAEAEAEAEFQALVAEAELEVEVQADNKKYNIMPTFVFKDENKEDTEEDEEIVCPICYDSIKYEDLITLNCSHQFCGFCITHILERHNNITQNPSCALCRTNMSNFDIRNPEVYNLVGKYCINVNYYNL